MIPYEETIQITYAKTDIYKPHNRRMYDQGNDWCYYNRDNHRLFEGHDNGWDKPKEYYQKIFERELREVKQQWKEEGMNYKNSEK
jgi:hypothetical protein